LSVSRSGTAYRLAQTKQGGNVNRRLVVVGVGIILICGLAAVSAQARWTGRLSPNPVQTDRLLNVTLRFEAVGRSSGHITDLALQISNPTDLPVTILWNESTLRLLRPLGRPELVLPFRHEDPETITTIIRTRTRFVQAIEYRTIQVTEESTLVLVLTVETAEGSHQEEWKGFFRFIDDEPKRNTNVWLTVAIAAAVLIGIVVLLPMLRS